MPMKTCLISFLKYGPVNAVWDGINNWFGLHATQSSDCLEHILHYYIGGSSKKTKWVNHLIWLAAM